jgi:glycosyltransferase involved in cell wall biosynthesis
MDVTVVTPTYNRAPLLARLHESLERQTFTRFEWLIVDDGSTDETREMVLSWNEGLDIRYLQQPNLGMKVAWNRGIEECRTGHVAVIGSDDQYLPSGLETLVAGWEGLDDSFVSVNGRAISPAGQLIGTPFRGTLDTDSFSFRYRHRIVGDTAGLARTEIVRRYPFPLADLRDGPEATAFNRMARSYKTRFLDLPVLIVDYQPDGLTARSRGERLVDPRPWFLYYREALVFPRPIPISTRLRFAANCLRFGVRTVLARRSPRT